MCRSPLGYGNMSRTYLRGRGSSGSPERNGRELVPDRQPAVLDGLDVVLDRVRHECPLHGGRSATDGSSYQGTEAARSASATIPAISAWVCHPQCMPSGFTQPLSRPRWARLLDVDEDSPRSPAPSAGPRPRLCGWNRSVGYTGGRADLASAAGSAGRGTRCARLARSATGSDRSPLRELSQRPAAARRSPSARTPVHRAHAAPQPARPDVGDPLPQVGRDAAGSASMPPTAITRASRPRQVLAPEFRIAGERPPGLARGPTHPAATSTSPPRSAASRFGHSRGSLGGCAWSGPWNVNESPMTSTFGSTLTGR